MKITFSTLDSSINGMKFFIFLTKFSLVFPLNLGGISMIKISELFKKAAIVPMLLFSVKFKTLKK